MRLGTDGLFHEARVLDGLRRGVVDHLFGSGCVRSGIEMGYDGGLSRVRGRVPLVEGRAGVFRAGPCGGGSRVKACVFMVAVVRV